MSQPGIELKRFTRKEYDALVECGVFTPRDRIELIDGLLVVAEPQSEYHYSTIALVVRVLTRAFGDGWYVRPQGPIALDDMSEPEPDIAVVRGDILDYRREHPRDPVLIVEVMLSSQTLDRRYKSSLYARAGRAEYWIVNLVDHMLEVRREPVEDPATPYGWGYSVAQVFRAGDHVTPLAAPNASIAVADLLP
jgi:Uma2 family endonuclease